FLLTCFNNMNVAVLEIFGAIKGTRPGQPVITITLSGLQTPGLELKGEVSVDDATSSMFAETSDFKMKPLLQVLRSWGPLTVTVELTDKTLSDQGRADAVEKFDKACNLD